MKHSSDMQSKIYAEYMAFDNSDHGYDIVVILWLTFWLHDFCPLTVYGQPVFG